MAQHPLSATEKIDKEKKEREKEKAHAKTEENENHEAFEKSYQLPGLACNSLLQDKMIEETGSFSIAPGEGPLCLC